MAKSPQLPYRPGNIPNDPSVLPTWLYDELWRIAVAINKQPEGLGVNQSVSVPIGTTSQETQLFVGAVANFDTPGGGWNETTGEWTAQVTGGYQLNLQAWLERFTQPGNRDYSLALRIYINDVVAYTVAESANEDYDSTATAALLLILQAGDALKCTITTQSEASGGAVTCNAQLSAYRVAG